METQFNDVMVDIETTGTQPEHTAIIQIAAVKFNLAERKLDTANMFNRCLLIPEGRFWDESTREWWGQQKRSILQEIYAKMEDPAKVMQDFGNWAGYSPTEPLRFWAKPTSFDYSFTQSYFRQFGVMNPFHFRYAVDMNSFIRGLARDSSVETFRNDFQGDAHNALFDVINQIDCVFKAMEHYQ
jgi:DNA polymerase III alpha subunit (gram-positive type)